MRRALREPRWLAGLAVAVVFALVCVWLAQWQLDRRVDRAERNAAVLDNYDSTPLPLPDVLPAPDTGLDARQQWQPVLLRGSYDAAGTVLVRNRPQSGSNGYLVTTPFVLTEPAAGTEELVLVRGWLPSGTDAASPGAVPDPPQGTVEVVVRLRSAEPPSDREAPPGQAYRIDPTALLETAAAPLRTAYGVVATEAGTPPASLAPVPRPDTDPGPHLAYGVQWYLFALAGLGIWAVLARRHAGEHDDDEAPAVAGTGPGDGTGARSGWVYEPGR